MNPDDQTTGNHQSTPSPGAAPGIAPGTSKPERSPSPTRTRLVAGTVGAVAALGAVGLAGTIGVNLASAQDDTTSSIAPAESTPDSVPDGAPEKDCGEMGDGMHAGRGMRGRGTAGEISAIDGASLTITDSAGESTTVSTTDDTTVSERVEASLADVAVGDTVRAIGEVSEDGSAVTAQRVSIGAAVVGQKSEGEGGFGRRGGRGVSGTVASVSETGFTVTTADDTTVTVSVAEDATVTETIQRSVADLEVGDTVHVQVQRDDSASDDSGSDDSAGDDSKVARHIVIGELPVRGR
ncbi:MAG: DUF5666 domain-containing protein [Microthrixaceae bacterium]